MKVLLVNGSPRANGNTALALNEMAKIFAEEGIETEILHVGNKNIRGCMACGNCYQTGKCVFDDMVNEGVYILIYFKFFSSSILFRIFLKVVILPDILIFPL